MERLEESAAPARALFDQGYAELAGDHLTASDLPLGPACSPPPRLLLGGGSDRLLEIAGRYADVVDLNGSSRRLKLGGPQPVVKDAVRRLTTTVDDLEDSVQRVPGRAVGAGRDPNESEFSTLISAIRFCSEHEIEAVEGERCTRAGIAARSLADCPYVFVGPAERMREPTHRACKPDPLAPSHPRPIRIRHPRPLPTGSRGRHRTRLELEDHARR